MNFSFRPKINKVKIGITFLGFVVVMTSLFAAFVAVSNWFNEYEVVFQKVIEVKTQSPVRVEKREMVSPVVYVSVEKAIEDAPNIAIAKYIIEKFGNEYAATALAIQKAENGSMNPEAVHINDNATIDVGVFQINTLHFGKDYCGSLREILDPYKNVDCAYNIFVRNGYSFNAWSSYVSDWYKRVLK